MTVMLALAAAAATAMPSGPLALTFYMHAFHECIDGVEWSVGLTGTASCLLHCCSTSSGQLEGQLLWSAQPDSIN